MPGLVTRESNEHKVTFFGRVTTSMELIPLPACLLYSHDGRECQEHRQSEETKKR